MKQERTYLIAMIAVALLASIQQIPVDAQIWGAILVIVGIVGGVMLAYQNVIDRVLIYVVAVALPIFDDSLNNIWVVGPWINTLLDNLATGIQGLAVGVLVMGLLARIQGSRAAAS